MNKSNLRRLGGLAIVILAVLGLTTSVVMANTEIPSDCDSILDVKISNRATLRSCSG
jgi:hypothetical protein